MGSSTFRWSRYRILGVSYAALLLMVGALLGAPGCVARRVRFDIAFSDACGLVDGDPLLYKGVVIGHVDEVRLDEQGGVVVTVEVDGRYRKAPYLEAQFSIEKAGGLLSSGAARQIVLSDPFPAPSRRTPIRDGAIVRGQDRTWEGLLQSLRDGVQRLVGESPGPADAD